MTGTDLLPHHAALVDASGIVLSVASARGYRSLTTRTEAERLGFGSAQRNVPALLLPVWSVYGEVATYQLRPDTPRVKDGKPLKYETPAGTRMVLDVPPAARQWLSDPKRPLFVTEGIRKADAAVSRGLCAIDLLGVWNWRGRNPDDGLTALPDWELVAMKHRAVYLTFDSDVLAKRSVHEALRRLRAFLAARGANVAVVYLPAGEGGAKQGLDDFLVAGHGVDDLLALATEELRPPRATGREPQPNFPTASSTVGFAPERPSRGKTCGCRSVTSPPGLPKRLWLTMGRPSGVR